MIYNYSTTKLLALLGLIILLILMSACTQPVKNNRPNQISNEAQQDSLDNFNELKYLFENKNYPQAYSLLNNMKTNLPYSRYTKHGEILEIHSFFERHKYTTAITKARNFIKAHPLHLKLDYVSYLRAISSYKLNTPLFTNLSQIPKVIEVNRSKVRSTFRYFSDLAQNYPNSSYFKDAFEKVKKLRLILAEYELNDAYILFEAAKYTETINRTDYILKNYPRSKSIIPALKLQAKSYRLLGQLDTAKSIEANLRRNYSE